MNRRERRRHEAAMRTMAAAEAKAHSPEAVQRRLERQAQIEREARETEGAERRQEAELTAAVDSDVELAACVAAILNKWSQQ
jgi:hypothetical protein